MLRRRALVGLVRLFLGWARELHRVLRLDRVLSLFLVDKAL